MVLNVILTAINFKGIEQVKRELKELAENCLCSESYIKSIIRKTNLKFDFATRSKRNFSLSQSVRSISQF